MPIVVFCANSSCGRRLTIQDDSAGEKRTCKCGQSFIVPTAPALNQPQPGPQGGRFRLVCPSCRQRCSVPLSAAGKKGSCPKCKATFLIPAAEDVPAELNSAAQSIPWTPDLETPEPATPTAGGSDGTSPPSETPPQGPPVPPVARPVPRDWVVEIANAIQFCEQLAGEAVTRVTEASEWLNWMESRKLQPNPQAVPPVHPIDGYALILLGHRLHEAETALAQADREYDALSRSYRDLRAQASSVLGRVVDFFRELFGAATNRTRLSQLGRALDEQQRDIDRLSERVIDAGGQLRTGVNWYCQEVAERLQRQAEHLNGILAADPPPGQDWSGAGWDEWCLRNAPSIGHTPLLSKRLRVGWLSEQVSNRVPRKLKGEAGTWLREALGPFRVPAIVPFIGANKAVVIEARGNKGEVATQLLQSLVFRTLALLGRQARFTLLDPSGLGRAFPMQRFLPNSRKPASDVTADLTAVLSDIRRINGEVLLNEGGLHELDPRQLDREPFDLVFVSNFPKGYDRRAVETMFQICENGPRAGRYVFLHYNTDIPLPHGLDWGQVENRYVLGVDRFSTAEWADFIPDGPPPQRLWGLIADTVRESAKQRQAFDWGDCVGLPETEWWRERATECVLTPVGVRGAEDKVELWLGVDARGRPCAHGRLAGQTGSGKSNFYHALILGLAVRYTPAELQFYLIDGKFGVEFEPYQTLPHARVVSLRSSPELARSVLDELYAEMERRNADFRNAGANDYTSFRSRTGQALPRLILLTDEFEFLFDGDRDGRASERLGQLARQGRSAGIHLLLGSQTFHASEMLDQRNTFANFQLHLSLQQNPETIGGMTEFGRNGKELLRGCDSAGKFVVTQTGRDEDCVLGMAAKMDRDLLPRLVAALARRAATSGEPRTVVFRGDVAPSPLDNTVLRLLRTGRLPIDPASRERLARREEASSAGGLGLARWQASEHPFALWLGRALTVHGHATALLRRGPAENLLLLTDDAPVAAGVLAGALVAVAALSRATEVVVRVCYAGPDSDGAVIRSITLIDRHLLKPLGFQVRLTLDPARAEGEIDDLSRELDARSGNAGRNRPSILSVLIDPERMPALRRTGDPLTARAPRSDQMRRLLTEGPTCGLHFAVVASGWLSFTQAFGKRHELPLFAHRVATQISKDDSFDLFGNGEAAQLHGDGGQLGAAIYSNTVTNEQRRFRAYCSPESGADLDRLADDLKARRG